ncbi:MAG TPA: hypothetical protein VE690_19400 [Rhodopila sp.]|nr:hypothetical protein [Rhodopila sp.]
MQESCRVGDVLGHPATLTRLVPDDAHLTNVVMQERDAAPGGRSASAAHPVTLLGANPAIRDAAFTAPVLRGEDAAPDTFMITGMLMP